MRRWTCEKTGAAPCPILCGNLKDGCMIKFATQSEREEKCVKRARRQVQLFQKWGRWWAIFCLLLSITFVVLGIMLFNRVLDTIANIAMLDPKINQQQIEHIKMCVKIGLTLGVGLGFIFLKAAQLLAESIFMLRGDTTSHLLIKYHDGILALMQNQNDNQLNDQQTK
jgi:hypothetical protein